MKIKEEDFATQIEDLLDTFKWRWTHSRPALSMKGWRTPIAGHKGFTDYVAVRDGTCLFIELKSEDGKLSEEQNEWRIELERVAKCSLGVQYLLLRPSDYERAVTILR